MFCCLPSPAWAELSGQRGIMAEYPNQSQPNQGLRPDGAPCIQPLLLSTYLLSSPEDGLSGLSSFLIMIFPGQSFVAPPPKDRGRGRGRRRLSRLGFSFHRLPRHTLCGVCSVVMFCFVFFLKFRLPMRLHGSYFISSTASGTFQNCFIKCHD